MANYAVFLFLQTEISPHGNVAIWSNRVDQLWNVDVNILPFYIEL